MNTDHLKTRTGAVYTRVSTATEQTTEQQKSFIADWLARKGLSVQPDMWFDDTGWSRADADIRPQFQRMLKLAHQKKVGYIVVFAQDRFGARDAYHLLEFLIPLRKAGCEVWSVTQEHMGNLASPEVMPLIMSSLNAATSEAEINSKAARALAGLKKSAEAGNAVGECPPYGFDQVCISPTGEIRWRLVWERYDTDGRAIKTKIDSDGRKTAYTGRDNPRPDLGDQLKIAPSIRTERIRAVRLIFSLLADGHSTREIMHRLAKARCPAVFPKGTWMEPQIRSMLLNPVYWRGAQVRNRHSHSKHKQLRREIETVTWDNGRPKKGRTNPREFWVWPKNPPYLGLVTNRCRPGEGIVTEQEWEDAYSRLIGRKGSPIAVKNPQRWFAGLVVCGGCGKSMHVAPGKRVGYACASNRAVQRMPHVHRPDPDTYCRMNFVAEWQLESAVKRWLDATGQKLSALSEIPPAAILGMAEEYIANDPDQVLANLLPSDHPVRPNLLDVGTLQRKYWGILYAMLKEVKAAGQRPANGSRKSIIKSYEKLYLSRLPNLERRLGEAKEELTRMMANFARITNSQQQEVAQKLLDQQSAKVELLKSQISPLTSVLDQVELDLRRSKKDLEEARRLVLENDPTGHRQRAEALKRVVSRIVVYHRPGKKVGRRLESELVRLEVVPHVGGTTPFSAAEINRHRPGVPPESSASRSSALPGRRMPPAREPASSRSGPSRSARSPR